MSEDEAAFFDWDVWSTSAKGNRWFSLDDCRATIYPDRDGEGFRWCVDWDGLGPWYSFGASIDRDAARDSAWREGIVPGRALIAAALEAAREAKGALARLTAWQRRVAVIELERWLQRNVTAPEAPEQAPWDEMDESYRGPESPDFLERAP